MKNNKKKNYLLLIIFILIFSLIWLGNLYLDIKFANKVEQVKIDIDTNDDVFNLIDVYRISPTNNNVGLVKDNIYKSFYSEKRGYFKKIKIAIPLNVIDELLNIKIKIGEKEFIFSRQELLNQWQTQSKDGIIYLYSPDFVRNSKSRFPVFNKIINWSGDINIFIKSFISTFLSLCFIAIFLYFIFYLMVKSIPKNISKNDFKNKFNILNENSKKIILKSYKDRDGDYYLNENISIKDKINLFFLFDNKGNQYYKIIFWIIFGAILLFALLQRMVLNQLPYLTGDAWGYLGSAILKFDTGNFFHIAGRSFPYPLFILVVLKVFNDFSYICIIQHIIGIISGIILFFIWCEIYRLFSVKKRIFPFYKLVGLLLMGLYLFSESSIVLEHYLLRESIYPFFLLLQVYFFIKFVVYIRDKSKLVYITGILFFINNYFLFIFQPRWGFTLFFNILIYIICFFKIKKLLWKKILLLWIVPILACFILIYVPENFIMKNETATKSFLYSQIFFSHAKIIDIELKKDVIDNKFTKYDKEILKKLRVYFKEVFDVKKGGLTHIGYNANSLIYGKARNYLDNKLIGKEYIEFCRYYFIKAVLKHPLIYLRKVLLELSLFYNFKGTMYPQREFKIDRKVLNYSYDQLPKLSTNYFPYRSYLDALRNFKKSYYDFNEIRFPGVRLFFMLLSKMYLICFVSFFILFIKQLIDYFKTKKYSNEFLFGIIVFILFMYNFCINLTNAIIYTLDVGRYIDDQFILVILSQFLAIGYVLRIIKMQKSIRGIKKNA